MREEIHFTSPPGGWQTPHSAPTHNPLSSCTDTPLCARGVCKQEDTADKVPLVEMFVFERLSGSITSNDSQLLLNMKTLYLTFQARSL